MSRTTNYEGNARTLRSSESGLISADPSHSSIGSGAFGLSAAKGQYLRARTSIAMGQKIVRAMALTRAGRRLVVASNDLEQDRSWKNGSIRLISLMDTRALWLQEKAHEGEGVWSLAISADERHVLSTGSDCYLRTWQLGDGVPVRSFRCDDWLFRVRASQEGALMAAACADGSLYVWGRDPDSLKGRLWGHTGAVCTVAIRSDDLQIASAGYDGSIRFWCTRSCKAQYAIPKAHDSEIWVLEYSKKGRLLGSGSNDGVASVWDLERRARVCIVHGHTGPIFSLTFCPGGHHFLTASQDELLRLWSVQSGMCLISIRAHETPLYGIVLDSNGKVYTCGGDGHVRSWNIASLSKQDTESAVMQTEPTSKRSLHVSRLQDELVRYQCKLEGLNGVMQETLDGMDAMRREHDKRISVLEGECEHLLKSMQRHINEHLLESTGTLANMKTQLGQLRKCLNADRPGEALRRRESALEGKQWKLPATAR